LVVQSQIDEFNVAAFRNFLSQASRQARASNPSVAVVAQLATAPNGQSVTTARLVNAARSVSEMVQSFSLNARTSDVHTAAGVLQSFAQS
jgi:hypothetical protein